MKLYYFVYLFPFIIFSQQEKFEVEERIDIEAMPIMAKNYLTTNLPEALSKIRYYYETDGEKKSYEAKFKLKRQRYSVEFSETGSLEDIEVQVEEDQINPTTLHRIHTFLEQNHDRFKIEKIQLQFIDSAMMKAVNFEKEIPENLELIVATKNEGKLERWEMTFNAQGNLQHERKVNRASYAYLIF